MIRGLEKKHEHAAQKVARDTRPIGERVADAITNPIATVSIYSISALFIFFIPLSADVLFFTCLGLFIFNRSRRPILPFKLPKTSNQPDYNDLIPGTTKPKKAGGISFFGNDRVTKEELWFSNEDMRTHVLIFGSTGSGKTESLVSLAFNSLLQGSGFIYVDGKGDNSLFAKIFSMVRSMGREDDILLVNFMTGARDIIGPQDNRLSNTMNPFSTGSSSMLSQLVISLMDASSGDSSADMWKGRAINFVESLMKILCAMRDAGEILLDANTIRDYFILEKLEHIVVSRKFPRTDGSFADIRDLPPEVIDPLKNYVLNLPGYNPAKRGNQAGEVREQHGFITMQLTRVFGSMADTYGHIIKTNIAEVDFKDIVLNRRILVVLLPALEKSPDELSNLGKIIIASLKAMMASGLGDKVEGKFSNIISRKPTNSPSPFLCIMDEYGYYAVKGFAVVAAQARSLGFSAVFAGQDLPAFQKASKEEAASIGANCNIKICMKLEDPQETWEFFNKSAGETYVTNVSGFQVSSGNIAMNYMDTKNASVDRRQRIELLDLKDQREGEAHILFKSNIIRAEMFYANPERIEEMQLNHMLKIKAPSEQILINVYKRIQKFSTILSMQKEAIENIKSKSDRDIDIVHKYLNDDENFSYEEKGLSAVLGLLEDELSEQQISSMAIRNRGMSIFTPIKTNNYVERMIGKSNVNLFVNPILNRGSLLQNLNHIERLSGNKKATAKYTATKLVDDLAKLTEYPPANIGFNKLDKKSFHNDINSIIIALGGNPVEYTPPKESESGSDSNALINKETIKHSIKDLPDIDLDKFSDLANLSNLPDLPDLNKFEEQMKNIDGKPNSLELPPLPDDFDLSNMKIPTMEELEKLMQEISPHIKKDKDKDKDKDN